MPPKESEKLEYDADIGDEGAEGEGGEGPAKINHSSEHEEFLHPNMIKEDEELTRKSHISKSMFNKS